MLCRQKEETLSPNHEGHHHTLGQLVRSLVDSLRMPNVLMPFAWKFPQLRASTLNSKQPSRVLPDWQCSCCKAEGEANRIRERTVWAFLGSECCEEFTAGIGYIGNLQRIGYHIYIYTHIYIYMHKENDITCVCIYIYIYKHMCVCVCMC